VILESMALESFVLENCNNLDDECLAEIGRCGSALTSLSISSSPSAKPKMSCEGMKALENCVRLKSLCCWSSQGYCRGLLDIFTFKSSTLEDLGVSHCKNITGLKLECPSLVRLDIVGLKKLKGEHIDLISCATTLKCLLMKGVNKEARGIIKAQIKSKCFME